MMTVVKISYNILITFFIFTSVLSFNHHHKTKTTNNINIPFPPTSTSKGNKGFYQLQKTNSNNSKTDNGKKGKIHCTRLFFSGGATTGDSNDEDVDNDNDTNPKKATIPNEIFNLVKSIIGAGVLSLPAGIASFGNARNTIVPSICLITIMGIISAYTFSLIARVCQMTGATSYADAWDKTMNNKKGGKGKKRNNNRMNINTSWIVAASSALDCFAGNLTYSMVLADTFKDLLRGLFGTSSSLSSSITRSNVLLSVTCLILLPLCLIKNLSSLAPFSLIGILGMIYTSTVICYRFVSGSYALPNGKFLSDLSSTSLYPSFGTKGAMNVFSSESLILISMLSTAYIAHFNAPKFYNELQNNTIQRFNKVVVSSFGISILLYSIVSSAGFLTFGSSTAGLILNNYSTTDVLISFSRLAVAISLVFSYPLLFVGTRDGILDLIRYPPTKRTTTFMNCLTITLLGIITLLALKVTDLTFVASMSGALLGTSLIFIYPTLMFRGAIDSMTTSSTNTTSTATTTTATTTTTTTTLDDVNEMTTNIKWEKRLCSIIAILGIIIAGVGAKAALQN